jgi:hypothetical protein
MTELKTDLQSIQNYPHFLFACHYLFTTSTLTDKVQKKKADLYSLTGLAHSITH